MSEWEDREKNGQGSSFRWTSKYQKRRGDFSSKGENETGRRAQHVQRPWGLKRVACPWETERIWDVHEEKSSWRAR